LRFLPILVVREDKTKMKKTLYTTFLGKMIKDAKKRRGVRVYFKRGWGSQQPI